MSAVPAELNPHLNPREVEYLEHLASEVRRRTIIGKFNILNKVGLEDMTIEFRSRFPELTEVAASNYVALALQDNLNLIPVQEMVAKTIIETAEVCRLLKQNMRKYSRQYTQTEDSKEHAIYGGLQQKAVSNLLNSLKLNVELLYKVGTFAVNKGKLENDTERLALQKDAKSPSNAGQGVLNYTDVASEDLGRKLTTTMKSKQQTYTQAEITDRSILIESDSE